jgi:hypothetical protein
LVRAGARDRSGVQALDAEAGEEPAHHALRRRENRLQRGLRPRVELAERLADAGVGGVPRFRRGLGLGTPGTVQLPGVETSYGEKTLEEQDVAGVRRCVA